MVVVQRLGKQKLNGRVDEFWVWVDEEKRIACYANKMELSILFQKKFNAKMEAVLNFCKARDMWENFRVAANDDMLVMQEA